MRFAFLGLAMLMGALTSSFAQTTASTHEPVRGDVALTYQWLRTNAQPGDCGCFGLNGGGLSASVQLKPHWSAVFETGIVSGSKVARDGNSLTLASMYLGARYTFPQLWKQKAHSPQPFGQVLVGGAHAGGGVAGAGEGAVSFAARVGAGVDLPLAHRFALRLAEVDYNPTTFSNTTNNHQNNLLVSTGVAYRW